jgi:hypothetical protein
VKPFALAVVLNVRLRLFDLLGRSNRGFDDRPGIALIGALHGHCNNDIGVEIDGVFSFVRQARPAVVHLGDLGVGIIRVRPILIRGLLLAFAIQPR